MRQALDPEPLSHRPSGPRKGRSESLRGWQKLGWFLLIGVVYALHQDLWFWREARPLAFGFLPIGLTYHAAYCMGVAVLMWGLTRFAWPGHLEEDAHR